MGSHTEDYKIPSISYAELFNDDDNVRCLATTQLAQALKAYGACRIRDHGISQDIIDNCFEKSRSFFERPLEEKVADYENSGTTTNSRFVPFASEIVRGELHLDETLEFQHSVYDLPGTWSEPGRQLVETSKYLHEECNRVHLNLLTCLSSAMNLPRSLSSIHSVRNSFFAPYYYCFKDEEDNNTLRVPPHIDPTTMLFCFQDSLAGLEVADISNETGNISTTSVKKVADFIPTTCEPGEFILLIGHVLRRLVGEFKHSVHRVKRPPGTSGFHLNYWTVPDLDTPCDFGNKKEDVAGYLARVFPAALRNTVHQDR